MRLSVTKRAHEIIRDSELLGTCAIDTTVGNGLDTVFLARQVGADGLVIGFDVQSSALAATSVRLREAGLLDRAKLILDSHARLAHYLTLTGRSQVSVCMFNLGYLPGSDKSVITKPGTTIQALAAASGCLGPDGLLSIVAYTGHTGGREEACAVRDWAAELSEPEFTVMRTERDNRSSGVPELTIIRRKSTVHSACA